MESIEKIKTALEIIRQGLKDTDKLESAKVMRITIERLESQQEEIELLKKPLESIRINDAMFRTLMSYHGGIGLSKKERLDDLEERYGQKVEII